jgi:hypothetical protein
MIPSLEAKIIFYRHFASGQIDSEFGQILLQIVAKVEPDIAAQEPFLQQVLELLMWSIGISRVEGYLSPPPSAYGTNHSRKAI